MRIRRAQLHPELPAFLMSSSAGVLKAYVWRRCASAPWWARRGDRSDSLRRAGLQRQHRRGGPLEPAVRLDYVNDYLRQVKESKALLYAACDR